MDNLEIFATADGSSSLLNTTLHETYHSVHGAIQESMHVFIKHGLLACEYANQNQSIRILEVGFGTGLNALLTRMHANGRQISYESWEKYPLPESILRQLNYPSKVGDVKGFDEIHRAPWNAPTNIDQGFTLLKKHGDVLVDPIDGSYDIIYYDAFAPSKQPELWTIDILKKITDRLNSGGSWVTYCAKGQLKRDLASLGLTVESLPGPPGKKEMTRATFTP